MTSNMTKEEEQVMIEFADKVYALGFKNGQIEMKNKILMKLNRDWTLIPDADVLIKVMKKIDKIRLTKDFTKLPK